MIALTESKHVFYHPLDLPTTWVPQGQPLLFYFPLY